MAAYETLDSIRDLNIAKWSSDLLSFNTTDEDPYYKDHLFEHDVMHYLYLEIEMLDPDSKNWDFTASVYSRTQGMMFLGNVRAWHGIEGATYTVFSLSYFDPFSITIFDNLGNAISATDKIYLSSDNVNIMKLGSFVAPYTGMYWIDAGWNQGAGHTDVSLDIFADVDTATNYNKNISYELNFNQLQPNNLPTGIVEITGTPSQYQTLTATTNNLADADGLGTINYQWLKDGGVISGANKSTYVLTATDVGKSISVQASYTDKLQHSESVVSDATELVTPRQNSVPTGTLKIKGTLTQTQTLSVIDTLADSDGLGTINYQWLRDGEIIDGANNTSYVLTAVDVGKSISILASYTDLLENFESVTSPQTANIIAITSKKPTDGNDKLTGTTKNDILIGGLGGDTLTGGLGADVFKYTSLKDSGITTTTRDTITDFTHSEKDKIDLSSIDANEKLAGDQAFKFIGSSAFSKTDATGQLRFDSKTSILYGSTDKDSAAEFSIKLNGVSSLVADDFIL